MYRLDDRSLTKRGHGDGDEPEAVLVVGEVRVLEEVERDTGVADLGARHRLQPAELVQRRPVHLWWAKPKPKPKRE